MRQRSPRRKPRTPNEGSMQAVDGVGAAYLLDAVGECRGPSARKERGPQDDRAGKRCWHLRRPWRASFGAGCAMPRRILARLILICPPYYMELSRWPWLRVEERAGCVAFPEVGEDDQACDCRVGTPQRSEGVALERHYNQENYEVSHAEDHHHPDLREE
jgi:hypothetical protein